MYEVLGRLLETEINMVTRTNMEVRFTVTTASKKKSLKKFVQWPITFSSTVGKYTVKNVPSNLLPRVIETRTPLISSASYCIISLLLTKY